MTHLPFIIVAGDLVWKVALVGLVAGTYLVAWFVRRWIATRAARAFVREHVAKAGELHEGYATVRGILRDGAILSWTHQTGDPAITITNTPVIECAGTRVELAGKFTLVAGRWATSSTLWKPTVTERVEVGDEIVATGTIERVAGDGEAGYRESASRWIMTGGIAIAAVKPRARKMPIPWSLHAMIWLPVTAFTWFAVFVFFGTSFTQRIESQGAIRAKPVAIPLTWQLAVALPGDRPRATQLLGYYFESAAWSDAATDLRVELAGLTADHCEIARANLRAMRPDAAVVAGCDDDRVTEEIAMMLGDYAKVPVQQSLVAAVASGDRARALEAARHESALLQDPHDAECFIAYLEQRPISTTHAGICEVMAALQSATDEMRVERLDAIAPLDKTYLRPLIDELRAVFGAEPPPRDPQVHDLASPIDPLLWLVPFEKTGSERVRAELAVLRGDYAAAKTLAAPLHEPALDLAIARREGTAPKSTFDLYADPEFERVSCEGDFRTAIATALDGDGGMLATTIRECHIPWVRTKRMLLAALPLVTQHRAELAEAIRNARTERSTSPFDLVVETVAFRDAARYLGDTAETARWAPIAKRQLDVFADRDRVIAILLAKMIER